MYINGITDKAVAVMRAHARGCARLLQRTSLYTHLHQYDTATHAVCLGMEYGLVSDELNVLRAAAELHDLGKIPFLELLRVNNDKIIDHNSETFALIRQHSEIGAQSVEAMAGAIPLLAGPIHYVAAIVRTHHERYDGAGYPRGLHGENIPLLARILAIADAAKAMTTPERQWRTPHTVSEMLAEVRRCAGSQFDPELADLYCSLIEDDRISFTHSMITPHRPSGDIYGKA